MRPCTQADTLNTICAVNACTIVSRRELARARVLVSTFQEHHPDISLTVLVLDGVNGAQAIPGARMLALDELLGSEGALTIAGNPPEAASVAVLPHPPRRLLEDQQQPVLSI